MTHRLTRVTCLVLMALLASAVSWATYTDFSEDIQNLTAFAGSPADNSYAEEPLSLEPTSGETVIIRTDQKLHLNAYEPHLVPITNMTIAQVRELRPIARAICGMEGGRAQIVRDKVKGERFVQVTCPPWQWPFVKAALTTMDKSWLTSADDGSGIAVWPGHYRDIQSIDRVVSSYTGGITEFHTVDNLATHLNTPSLAGAYEKIASIVDIPAHEITVSAKFYETNTNNDLKLGLDYIAWKNGPGRSLFNFVSESWRFQEEFYSNAAPNYDIRLDPVWRWRYRVVDAYATAAYYDFLTVKGKAETVAEGTIQTVSGRFASWKAADPVVTIQSSGDTVAEPDPWMWPGVAGPDVPMDLWGRFVNYTRDIARGQVGMFLNIQPVIGTESTEMFVGATVSELVGTTPQGLPRISESSVYSNVRVVDGEKFLLAGLSRTEKVRQKAGMPILSDIPVLGYLFGGETRLDRQKDLVVTLDCTMTAGTVDAATGRPLSLEETQAMRDEGKWDAMLASKMEMSAKTKDIMAQATAEKELDVPMNAAGFDQWLLDPEK